MSRWGPVLALVLALALGAWFLFSGDDSEVGLNKDSADSTERTDAPTLEGLGDRPPAPSTPPPEIVTPTAEPWVLTGIVREKDGTRIAGVRVRAALTRTRGPTRGALPAVTTRPDGTFRVTLPADVQSWTPARRATTYVEVRAELEGYRPGSEARVGPLPTRTDHPPLLDMEIELTRGATVRGRVLDEAGAPVADAWVQLAPVEGSSSMAGSTDEQGTYVIAIPADGLYRVLARRFRGGGFASLGPVELAAKRSERLEDMRLGSADAIEGQVVFADGRPVPFAGLQANLKTPTDELPEGLTRWQVPHQVAGTTGEDGRFRLLPARAGEYAISLSDAFGGPESTLCRAGDRDVRIVLALHELVVRVLDTDGAPLVGASYAARSWRATQADLVDRVERGELDNDTLWSSSWASLAASVEVLSGEVRLLVPHGSAWLFTFDLGSLPPVEHLIRVPAVGNRSVHDLIVGEPTATGGLDLTILDPEGKAIEEFDFELRTKYGGTLAASRREERSSLDRLPIGKHKLKVEPGPARHKLDRMCQIFSPYLPIETDVTVTAGATKRLTLRARRGGWVRLHPILPSEDSPKFGDARLDTKPDDPEAEWSHIFMVVYGEGAMLRGTSDMKSGVPARLGRLFEPGLHHFRIQAKGYKEAVVVVRVTAGEETLAEVHLERAD